MNVTAFDKEMPKPVAFTLKKDSPFLSKTFHIKLCLSDTLI